MNRRRHGAFGLSLACLTVAVAWGPVRADAEAPRTLVPDAACVTATCHAGLKKTKFLHGPVAAGECTACHVPEKRLHKFALVAEGKKLCAACHGELKLEKVVHEPVKEGCTTCHSPHGSDSDKALLVSSRMELCATCHEEIVTHAEEAIVKHGAILMGKGCVNCHNPHSSNFAKRLPAETNKVCLSCHDKPLKAGKRTLANIKAEVTKKFVHGAIESEECVGCHNVHGEKRFRMLKAEYPAGFYAPFTPEGYALCFTSHDESLATEARVEDETQFRNGAVNLHHLHVNKKRKGRTCRACHAAHGSDQPHVIRKSVPFGKSGWSLPIRFNPTETGGSCASGCHRVKAYDREKPAKGAD